MLPREIERDESLFMSALVQEFHWLVAGEDAYCGNFGNEIFLATTRCVPFQNRCPDTFELQSNLPIMCIWVCVRALHSIVSISVIKNAMGVFPINVQSQFLLSLFSTRGT